MRQNIRNQQQILLPTTTGSKQSNEGVVTSGIPVIPPGKINSIFFLFLYFFLPYRGVVYWVCIKIIFFSYQRARRYIQLPPYKRNLYQEKTKSLMVFILEWL
jgi:hypothetical protein